MSQEHLPQNALYDLIENEDATYTLDIPEGVCSLKNLRNWAIYRKARMIRIPASMQEIEADVSRQFNALQEIYVHPDNPHFIVEDGVLFSADKKKIILYPRAKEGDTYRIDDEVEVIGTDCFAALEHLKNLYIGKGVRKIENCALARDMRHHLQKIYIPPTVAEPEGEIFDQSAADSGPYYLIEVVGGARGSAIETYCNQRGIDFVVVAEDEVEDFYATAAEELCRRAQEQAKQETEYWVDESDKGYRMHFADGCLEVVALYDTPVDSVTVSNTRARIGKYHRQQVKSLIIGAGITAIDNLAFDDYEELESIAIGPDVRDIAPDAFNGKNEYTSDGCCKVSTITVDERNKWYVAVDNVLYTADRTTLVKYAPNKPDLSHEVDARVRHIGDHAFENADNLQSLKVGEGCVSIGCLAFLNTADSLRHAYFAASVTDWPEETIFPIVDMYGYEEPWYNEHLVVGGPKDSAVQAYCAARDIPFHVIEEDQIADFMATPLVDGEDDPYLTACEKEMIVDKNGTVQQVGELREELVFPEGAIRISHRINLSLCKRVVIPSTLTSFLPDGLSGAAHDLAEFVVSEDNPKYMAVEGHLCDRDGCLLTYAPAAAKVPGVLPEGITAIGCSAFDVANKPFDKLCIPASVTKIEVPYTCDGWFREVEVHPDNPAYRAIDGSLYSADGKELVCAKAYPCGYEVPDGVEKIGEFALSGVKERLVIPPGVTEIASSGGLTFGVDVVRVTKGSYAEQHVKTTYTQFFKTEIVCPDGNVEVVEPSLDWRSNELLSAGKLPF